MDQPIAPVSIDDLRSHFAGVYRLDPAQVRLMLHSACRSVAEALDQGRAALEADDREKVAEFAHSLKGVLLNMGQSGWAEVARELELNAVSSAPDEVIKLVGTLEGGLMDLVGFYRSEREEW